MKRRRKERQAYYLEDRVLRPSLFQCASTIENVIQMKDEADTHIEY